MKSLREQYSTRLLNGGGEVAAKQSTKYMVIDFKNYKVLLGKSGGFRISTNGKLSDSFAVDATQFLAKHKL